ncbi:3-hydroxyisobutyrate/3-hydroxypropionate dehydrogenase [Microdochium nivale]|nr:3-hydroxyisobutyrate/3-hydroxypropionate dehydrogenase [Microdochium nivale]
MASNAEARYGFIGIGQMGWGMALNIRKKIPASAKMVICEVSGARRNAFIEQVEATGQRVEAAQTPREVAERADIIVTMLPKGEHVRHVYTDKETGLLSIAPQDRKIRFLECSTIEAATSTEVGREVARSGLGSFVDAPVSGGPNGANAGTLTLMVGAASEADYDSALPVLEMMGKNIFYCGAPGAGLASKQINNYLSAASTVAVCEAMNMGVKAGLDPKVLAALINVSSGRCYNSKEQNPVKGVTPGATSENDFAGGFSVELCKGVLEMAVALAKDVDAQLLLGDTILRLYGKAVADERTKGRDSRSVYRLIADGDA